MSEIYLDLDRMVYLNGRLRREARGIFETREQIEALKRTLSDDILKRRGIRGLIGQICAELEQTERGLGVLIETAEWGVERYRQVESWLCQEGARIGTAGQISPNAALFKEKGDAPDKGETEYPEELLDYKLIGDCILKFALYDDLKKATELLSEGVRFETYLKNGIRYIRLTGEKLKNLTYAEKIKLIQENVTGNVNWTKYDMKKLLREGVDLYNEKTGSFTRGKERFFNDLTNNCQDLDGYIKGLDSKGLNYFGANFKNAFWKELNLKELVNFKDLTRTGKFLKGLDVISTVYDLYDAFSSNLYKDGNLQVNAQTLSYSVSDAVVNLGSGAAAVATGSAIGSFFAPPVGTVVGAVAGAGINYAINVEIFDINGDGQADSLTDMVKIGTHEVIDCAADFTEGVGDFFCSLW